MKNSKQSNKLAYFLNIIFISLIFWIAVTTTIQRFKCGKLTETELFKLIPNSFICDWKYCN